MTRGPLETFFAPAERLGDDALAAEIRALPDRTLLARMLDSFPEPAALLNEHRQICMANDKLAQLVGRPKDELVGMRPGEALDCVHAREREAGCGTSVSCRECGAVRAIVDSLRSREPDVQECRITARDDHGGTSSLDLRVWSTPLELNGGSYTVFALRDITDEKRRLVLERIFFHDVLNTAGGLHGILEMWPHLNGEEAAQMTRLAQRLSEQVIEEISAQRDLASAERGELVPKRERVDVRALLDRLSAAYGHHATTRGSRLAPHVVSGDTAIWTDGTLLARVLGNLIKNALEVSEPSQVVTVAFTNHDVPTFTVHNQAVMSEGVQLQVFQRSFTTKFGPGRGVGTYSVKLLTERYLDGEVTFRSTEGKGTTFVVRLPRHEPRPASA